MAASIAQRLGWDAACRQVQFEPKEPSFADFAVTAAGPVLYQDYEFAHVIEALEPAPDYAFGYAQLRAWLRPQGLLGFRR